MHGNLLIHEPEAGKILVARQGWYLDVIGRMLLKRLSSLILSKLYLCDLVYELMRAS